MSQYGNYTAHITPIQNAKTGKKYVRNCDGSYSRYTTPTTPPIKTLQTRR